MLTQARILGALLDIVEMALGERRDRVAAAGSLGPLLRLSLALAVDVRAEGASARVAALLERVAEEDTARYATLLPELLGAARVVVDALVAAPHATTPSLVARAVRMVAPSSPDALSAAQFGQLLLLAHHPVLHSDATSARSIHAHRGVAAHPFRLNPAVWRSVCWRLRGIDARRAAAKRVGTPFSHHGRTPDAACATPIVAAPASWGASDAYVAAIAAALVGDEGLESVSPRWRDAARASIAGLALAPKGDLIVRAMYNALLPKLALGVAQLAALDADAVATCRGAPGVLVRAYDAAKATLQQRKAGAHARKELTAEEVEWARIEKKRRLAKGLPEEDIDVERQALIVREGLFRENVANAVRPALEAARSLATLAHVAPRKVRAELATLVDAHAPAGSLAAHVNALLLEASEIVGAVPLELLTSVVAATGFALPRTLALCWVRCLRAQQQRDAGCAPALKVDEEGAMIYPLVPLFADLFAALPAPCGRAKGVSLARLMSSCPGTRQLWLPIVAHPIASSSEESTHPLLREALALLQVMATPPRASAKSASGASGAAVACWRAIRTHLADSSLLALTYAPAYKPSPVDVLVAMFDAGAGVAFAAVADDLAPLLTGQFQNSSFFQCVHRCYVVCANPPHNDIVNVTRSFLPRTSSFNAQLLRRSPLARQARARGVPRRAAGRRARGD